MTTQGDSDYIIGDTRLRLKKSNFKTFHVYAFISCFNIDHQYLTIPRMLIEVADDFPCTDKAKLGHSNGG